MNGLEWARTKIKHARAKRNPAQLVRVALLRVWPFSVATRGYYRIRYWEPIWTNVVNRKARRALQSHPPVLDGAQRRAVEQLRRDGICVMHIDELMGEPGFFSRLDSEARKTLETPELKSQISRGATSVGGKQYVLRATPPLAAGNELVALAFNNRIVDVVNGYLGVWSRLKNFEFWYNLPVSADGPPVASQQWHRDYDDHKMVKVFVYLVDVDESMGPFTFMRGTQPGGEYGHIFPVNPPEGSYPGDDRVEKAVPSTQIQVCTANAGTIILCDASGFHRGGRSVTRPRILFTLTYATDGAIEPDFYPRGNGIKAETLTPAVRYATRLSR